MLYKGYRSKFVLVFLAVILIISSLTVLHNLGMQHLEERSLTFLQSLEFVTQTMTTVGYGQEAGWEHSAMYFLAILTQFTGIIIAVTAVPMVLAPWIQERLRRQPHRKYYGPVPEVLIAYYSDDLHNFLEELKSRDIAYLLIEPDEHIATEQFHKGYNVLNADPEDIDVLEDAEAASVEFFVFSGNDEQNATVSLAFRELSGQGAHGARTIAIARQTGRAVHLARAGVRDVVYPREIIGRALAHRIVTGSGISLDFGQQLPENFEIREYPVRDDSALVHEQVNLSELIQEFKVGPVGVWRDNGFKINLPQNFSFQRRDTLILAGTAAEMDRFGTQFNFSSRRVKGHDLKVVIIGYGHEGQAARQLLLAQGIKPVVINDIELEEVDVVGDGMQEEVLLEAGVDAADVVLITVSADNISIMITLLVRSLNQNGEVFVQARSDAAVKSIYRAGANYVQSLAQIASRMISGYVFKENVLDFNLNIELMVVEVAQGAVDKDQLQGMETNPDITVLGILSSGDFIPHRDQQEKASPGEKILLAGSHDSLHQYIDATDLLDRAFEEA